MDRRAIALVAVGIALVAASARAQSQQRVLAPTVFATRDLPANAITTFTTTCRPGFVATSAGVTKRAAGATLLAVVPVGARAYRFRFGNPVTNDRQRVTVAVACRKIAGAAGAKYRLKLKPPKPAQVTAPAGKSAAASLACPSGTVPAGAGADLDPNRQKSAQAYRGGLRLSIRRETSTLSRFSFSVQNTGSQPRTVVFYGGCVTLARAPGAPRERLHVEVTTFSVDVSPGSRAFTRRCRRGWFSLAAGFALPGKLIQADGAAAVGSGGRWSVSSDAVAPARANLQLVCARLAP